MKIELSKSDVEDILTALDDAIASREEEMKATCDKDILECCDDAITAFSRVYHKILRQSGEQGC